MLTAGIAIIGGGLSGLYAALLLEQQGITNYLLFEAREIFGGRIVSVPRTDLASPEPGQASALERYDLGATWFWPEMQPELLKVIREFDIPTFKQYETGDMLVERSPAHPPVRFDGYASLPPALRLAGGMGALTAAIRNRLTPENLMPAQRVTRLTNTEDGIELAAKDAHGRSAAHRVSHVLLAAPPRLAVNTIEFTPALPDRVALQWQGCATWMAPHAKYLAVFDRPFWREQGLSGSARSSVGPMVEIHDASPQGKGAALFGFLGVPAETRKKVPEATLLALCRAQLVRLFGKEAEAPGAEFLKDWAIDPCTAVAADHIAEGHHPASVPFTPDSGPWKGRVIGIASEWSPMFSGYVAGAIDAARRGVDALERYRVPVSGSD